jgi:hypothetical protein
MSDAIIAKKLLIGTQGVGVLTPFEVSIKDRKLGFMPESALLADKECL